MVSGISAAPVPPAATPVVSRLPIPADQYQGSVPTHDWVSGADAATYRRVYGALGAASGAFASHLALVGGAAAAGAILGTMVPFGGALVHVLTGVAGGAAGAYLGAKLQGKTLLGRHLGGRMGGLLGGLAGTVASAVGIPLRSDHIEETRSYSYREMTSLLGTTKHSAHPRLSGPDIDGFMAALKPGDMIVTNDESSTIWAVLIGLVDRKADFTHAILYAGNGKTLESRTVTKGVAEGDLRKVLAAKHHAVAIRPRYTSPAQADAAVKAGYDMVGKPYDFKFKWGDDSLYCSEFVHNAVQQAAPHVTFEKRAAIGRLVVLPGDLLRTKQADVVAEVGRDTTLYNAYLAKFVK